MGNFRNLTDNCLRKWREALEGQIITNLNLSDLKVK